MSCYDKLSEFLSKQVISSQRMTFRKVEQILGFSLPNSAYKYQAWWANNPIPNRQSYAWLSVGWETSELDLAGQKVTLRRIERPALANPKQSPDKPVAQAKTKGTSRLPIELPFADTPPVQVTVDMMWRRLGSIAQGSDGNIAFPSAPTAPGLYRFRLIDGDSTRHYIGETAELRRRFQHYRRPGPSQATNIRVNALLREHLAAGGISDVDIIVDGVTLTISSNEVDADLSDKATRRLLENAALVAEGDADIDTLNR